MAIFLNNFLLLFCFLSAAISDDRESLLSFKTAFQDSYSPAFKSWESNVPTCQFQGITCNSDGFVTEIELSNKSLTGFLPYRSICQLKFLEKLSLGFNKLHGAVDHELNNCSSLEYLDLGNNCFSGSFPDISLLNGLVTLYANNSGLEGTFPWDSLRNMENLQVLSLGNNPFDRMPFPGVILNLTKLNWLYLTNCSIEGEIPEEIGNLVELINLELAMNYITGEIPVGITKLNKLWQLELYWNNLSGELPPGLRNLNNLEFFDASRNNLHGNISEVRFMKKLKSLELYSNQLSGEVPDELGDFRNLVNLSLYGNKLTGQLPHNLGSWAHFCYIDVSDNLLTGPIPPDMCKKGTMIKLLILKNKFTGEIPSNYAKCSTLIRFRVNDNKLSGWVPGGIWGLPKLQIIDLSNNDFGGPISSDIGNAKSLVNLFLANNKLSGELPSDISRSSSLVSIDLRNNQFSGQIPDTIGELRQLTSLLLQGNQFSGSIPDSLGSCLSINEINMAQNTLSGPIPASLGLLSSLNFLNLSRNQLSGSIPWNLASLTLNLLDLSDNCFIGSIPDPLLTEANNGSFTGNAGLCTEKIRGFHPCSPQSSLPHHLRLGILCLMVASITMLASLTALCCLKNKKKHLGERSLKEDSWDLKSFHLISFTEDEIMDSIKEQNLIGKGGSGNVYRVVIGSGEELAVKHIWHLEDGKKMVSTAPILSKHWSNSKEFKAEVQTLSSIRHVNVVKLYCSISSEESSLLVYEYMPNGSLWDRLHTCNKLLLDWETRYQIALGAAKGLEYLHHDCARPVIHGDIKSSNILLDKHMKPRIADFGLSKIVGANSGKESTQFITGTYGYIAPEYAYTNKVNEKSDLYSFGVVLMELVTGKRPMEPEFGENKDIVDWVSRKTESWEGVMSLLDSSISEAVSKSAIEVLKVAFQCSARNPSVRPTMRNVVKMLEDVQPHKLFRFANDENKDLRK